MFNNLIKVYGWYYQYIRPSCAPQEYDDNILAPIYYGKVPITAKSNAVEVVIAPSGEITMVRKFGNTPKDSTVGERYALTPSCIQHRRRGASANDREYQFFNKFSVLFGDNRVAWLTMFSNWIDYHMQSGKPASVIDIIRRIVDVVQNTDRTSFIDMWDHHDDDVEAMIDDRTILVFTDNGKKIFDNNPDLYESYRDFYEHWCCDLYDVREGISNISGETDLIVKTKDGGPLSFGIGYSNGRKMITKTNDDATLNANKRFDTQKNFANYTTGIRDLWKIHSVFDYLAEQQDERDPETRHIFFFVPSAKVNCTYEQSLLYKEMLTALKQYHEGYKWQCPPALYGVQLCYIYWTSSSNGRSSIADFQELPAEQYVENVTAFYEFFASMSKFCLFRIPNMLETESKFVKVAQHELIRAILCARPVPEHIVKKFVRKSLNPIKTSASDQASRHPGYSGKYTKYYYRNVLETTAGILLYNEQIRMQERTVKNMALDRTSTDRSYLYGRLVAIYQRAEEIAMSSADKRTTNAEKSMSMLATRPYSTIQNLGRRVQPYLNRLSNTRPTSKVYVDKLLQETYGNFEPGEFENNTPLTSNYLLGYYCQRQDMFAKQEQIEEGEEDTNA